MSMRYLKVGDMKSDMCRYWLVFGTMCRQHWLSATTRYSIFLLSRFAYSHAFWRVGRIETPH